MRCQSEETLQVLANSSHRSDFCDGFKVLVGEHEKEYFLHQSVAGQTSLFFRASFSNDWKEAQDKVVRLPTTFETSFAIYVCWLYTGNIELLEDDEGKPVTYDRDSPISTEDGLYESLVDSCILGDYLQDVTFGNAIVDKAQAVMLSINKPPGCHTIRRLWDALPHSKLARLFIDVHATLRSNEGVRASINDLPLTLWAEIATIGIEERSMKNDARKPQNRPRCFYHVHNKEDEKCK